MARRSLQQLEYWWHSVNCKHTAYSLQARLHTGLHRITMEIDQIFFYHNYIFNKKTFQVKIWKLTLMK